MWKISKYEIHICPWRDSIWIVSVSSTALVFIIKSYVVLELLITSSVNTGLIVCANLAKFLEYSISINKK